MKHIRHILLFFMLSLSVACSDELDLTADYQDVTVVYGLLNPADAVHYIRIHRAFLLNGNVLEAAQVADSSVYDPADLTVALHALDAAGQVQETIPFEYVQGAVTEPGIFSPSGIMLYRSSHALNASRYRLQINNMALNKQITAETDMFSGVKWIKPAFADIGFDEDYELLWTTVAKAKVSQPEIIFHWTEVNLQTGETKPDSGVRQFFPREVDEGSFTGTMNSEILFPSFYATMVRLASAKPGFKKVIGPFTFKIYAGTPELANYLNAVKPGIGLIQDKPSYSNIKNGIGIFACRTVSVKENLWLTEPAKDSLIFGRQTGHLGFSRN